MTVTAVLAACLAAAAAASALRRPEALLTRRVEGAVSRRRPVILDVLRRVDSARSRLRTGRKLREQRGAVVREACDVIAAELRAGHDPARALESAAVAFSDLATVAAVSRMGGDVPAALREVAAVDRGAPDLGQLAVAWSVAASTGAGLAALVERTASCLREEEALRREVAAQLAGPRASARMLACLPVLGLALGMGVGSDPIGFLIGSPYGWVCLVLAILLATAGLAWVERLARRAERPT